jgi:vancomycin resistance protein YoaR
MAYGTALKHSSSILFGSAAAMAVVAGGLVVAYLALPDGGKVAAVAVAEPKFGSATPKPDITALTAQLGRTVTLRAGSAAAQLKWSDLGVEVDPDELLRVGTVATAADVAKLAAAGSVPLRVNRAKAVRALTTMKAHHDQSPIDAYLDLEARSIEPDRPGQGIDVYASIGRIEAAAREAAPTIELVSVAMPARVSKQDLRIDDISHVMGHYMTRFSVADRERNFNLKLAASKINGTVLQPDEEWSFNGRVGERSEKEGYKVAHVITAGEMVDGLAGGTCQISTTLFGAAFFAGLEIPKTTNHSRPSVYTPVGFDATVVWPNTDLVIKNPYPFPVALHYRVANGEAVVEILGKQRPFDKVVFARKILEETPFPSEERLDDEIPEGETLTDQPGFNGYKLLRFRRFFVGKKLVREQKWTVNYKPVTEYLRRGTSQDPNAKMPVVKEPHGPQVPKHEEYSMAQ